MTGNSHAFADPPDGYYDSVDTTNSTTIRTTLRGLSDNRNCNGGCLEKTTPANNSQGGGTGEYPGNSNWRTGQGIVH